MSLDCSHLLPPPLGHSACFIHIKKFRFAIVDPADYDQLRRYKWRLNRSNRTFYAFRTVSRGPLLKPRVIWMHRQLANPPDGLLVDHITTMASTTAAPISASPPIPPTSKTPEKQSPKPPPVSKALTSSKPQAFGVPESPSTANASSSAHSPTNSTPPSPMIKPRGSILANMLA